MKKIMMLVLAAAALSTTSHAEMLDVKKCKQAADKVAFDFIKSTWEETEILSTTVVPGAYNLDEITDLNVIDVKLMDGGHDEGIVRVYLTKWCGVMGVAVRQTFTP